jgi:hypothetical protein
MEERGTASYPALLSFGYVVIARSTVKKIEEE